MTLGAFCLIPSGEMHIKFTLSHRTRLPASVIATSLPLYFITDLQLAHKETTYWPKYTIKCVGFSIRLPYTTETVNLAKPLGNNILVRCKMHHGGRALLQTAVVTSTRHIISILQILSTQSLSEENHVDCMLD